MGTDTLQALHNAVDLAFAQRSAELAQRAIDLDNREAAIAEAAELLAIDPRVSTAFAEGQSSERHRISTLINMQLEHLAPRSATRLVLLNLQKMINEAA